MKLTASILLLLLFPALAFSAPPETTPKNLTDIYDVLDAIWMLLFTIGMVVCFALGAVHGHQR